MGESDIFLAHLAKKHGPDSEFWAELNELNQRAIEESGKGDKRFLRVAICGGTLLCLSPFLGCLG